MTPERWQQIDQLFHSALEHEPGARAAFLAQACTGDESLRREVESLIESHEQADSFIEAPAADIAAGLLAGKEAQLAAGHSVGSYRIVSLLGEGGMGEVYLAQDTRLGRQVALKRLPAQFTLDGDRVRRFEQEARAASALNHPNIVTIHEIGHSNSLHFITTEFIDGETLRQHLATARMKLDEVLDVATQIASAVAAAHAAGIAHRDIKPENIMLRRDRIVKVLDFGLAKLASPQVASVDTQAATRSTVKTNPGMVMGTVQYMSPEQARGKEVDARTDIWSLGVVLYEMVTGRVPFEGETPSHVVVSIIESEPPSLALPEVPTKLERIITKALRKNKDERYQTASDLALDLKSLKQELEVDARLKQSFDLKKFGAAEKFEGDTPSTLSINAHPTSGAEYLVSEIRRDRRVVLPVLAVLVAFAAVTAMAAYFAYSRYRVEGGRANIDSMAEIRTIAVLPFANTSKDPETEYLSDGVSDSLINSLSQLPGVKVIARSSSFKYKGKEADPQEAARALGVEAILTGRVVRRGDNLIFSVELMDARDATHMWGKQYNRRESDLLAVQADISREIAEVLRPRLTPVEQQQLARRETVNPKAYELLLKGRFWRNKGGTENRKKAVEHFQKAIAADPTYALAYAELSLAYSSLVNENILDPKVFTPKAEEAARNALALDQNLAEAHLAMASIKTDAWDWTVAEREFKRAIELNPSLSRAHIGYTFYLSIQGRGEQALAEANRARELDPISTASNRVVVYGLISTRQYDQALEAAKRMLELDQSNPNVHTVLGQIYEAKGQYLETVAAYQEAIRLGDLSPDAQIMLGAIYAKTGQLEKTRAIFKQLRKGKEYVSPVGFAVLHVALGEREQAFALLEQAYAAHDQQLIWLGVEGLGEGDFAPLSSDPRFQELLRRVGLR